MTRILAALALTLTLAGCGNDSPDDLLPANDGATAIDEGAAEPVAEETEASEDVAPTEGAAPTPPEALETCMGYAEDMGWNIVRISGQVLADEESVIVDPMGLWLQSGYDAVALCVMEELGPPTSTERSWRTQRR